MPPKSDLSEADICTRYITPAIEQAGWHLRSQVRQEVTLTDGRITVRGNLSSRGPKKRADYVLYHKPSILVAVIEVKDNNHSIGASMQQVQGYAEWVTPKNNVVNRRRNAGTILSTAFRKLGTVDGGVIRYCEFKNVSFGDATLVGVTFSDCSFKDVHLEMTKFNDCRFVNCFADGLNISGKTVLDIQGLEPGENIRSISLVDTEPIFSPSEIARVLSNAGAQLVGEWERPLEYSQNAQDVIDLLRKLIRQYRRANVLCVQDYTLQRMFQDPNWQVLGQILIAHGIISEEIRPTSGKRKSFIRLRVLIPDLMRHEDGIDLPDDDIGKFWQAVRAL